MRTFNFFSFFSIDGIAHSVKSSSRSSEQNEEDEVLDLPVQLPKDKKKRRNTVMVNNGPQARFGSDFEPVMRYTIKKVKKKHKDQDINEAEYEMES